MSIYFSHLLTGSYLPFSEHVCTVSVHGGLSRHRCCLSDIQTSQDNRSSRNLLNSASITGIPIGIDVVPLSPQL